MSNKIIIKPINGVGDKFINIIGASVYCYYKKYDLKIIFNDLLSKKDFPFLSVEFSFRLTR